MVVDTTAAATLQDGDFTNGEQYMYSTLLPDGTHTYYFDTTDGLEGALLPPSGNLSGPIVTNTFTGVGINVVVRPDPYVTVTYTQVTATGDTYVTRSQTGSALPAGYLHGSIPAYFDISTTATYTGKIKICYTYDDAIYFGVGYGGERGLRWLHFESGEFKDRTVMLDINNNVVCGEVYSLSTTEFSAAVEQATLITLTSFKASVQDAGVLLTLTTASEVDSMGFNILRGTSPDGPFTRINDWVIRSNGSATRGMKYSFEDTGTEKGVTYFYKLENMDISGRIATHMIASVTTLAAAPSVDQALQEQSVTKPADNGLMHQMVPLLQETRPDESNMKMSTPPLQKEGQGGDGLSSDETNTGMEKVLPQLLAPQPERVHGTHEIRAQEARKEVEKPFSIKLEDDAGNIMQVRLPELSEAVQEPFELTTGDDGKITLKWSGSGNVKGFNILRGDGEDKKFKKVNLLPIPFFVSQAGNKGLIYSFKDAGVQKDKQYIYKIETILTNGTHNESIPIEIPIDSGKKTEKSPVKRPVSPKK